MLGFLPISEGPISYIPQQTTADVVVPVMTGGVTISSITSSGFTASWSAATDNIAVTGYELSTDNGTTYTAIGNVLTYASTGLQASTLYNIKVRAFDAAGNRATPISTTATTSATVDVAPPTLGGTITITNITAGGFTASWSAATDNVGVIGYEISVDTGTPSYSSVGNVLITTKIGLSSTTLYSVRVRAFDSTGNRSTPLLTTVTTSTAVSSNLLQNTSNNLVVTTPTIIALTSSNTSITYNKHTGQVLVLYNSSGSNVIVNIKGSATNNIPIPNAAGTTISLTTGMNIIVASGMFTWVMLDKCYAYLSGDVTITASVDNVVMSCLMVR